MENIREHIQSFSELEIGWSFGEGGPISQETIDRALKLADNKQVYSAYPNTDLSIGLCYLHSDSCDDFLVVRILPDGFYEADYEKGVGPNYKSRKSVKNLDEGEILLIIKMFSINLNCFVNYVCLKWS